MPQEYNGRALYAKTKKIVEGFGGHLPRVCSIVEVTKPITKYPREITGALFLPGVDFVLLWCDTKDSECFTEWEHKWQVTKHYGFNRHGRTPFKNRETLKVTEKFALEFGEEFVNDLFTSVGHRALAKKWDLTPQQITHQRKVRGIKIQQMRRKEKLDTA